MHEPHYLGATDLAAAIRARDIGCVELLDHFLQRVERHNPALNAIVWMDVERARERAREADAALSRNDVWGPLHGVPMTIKESYDVAGAPTTWGDPRLAGNIAQRDAVAVQRLRDAGVVLFGKTNVPINLADWQSYNAIHGSTSNPWDLGRTPGGSSGGSAAALAAGLTGLEAGSDIGASIRNPAHYCGVYGHKPTYGIVPGRGQALPGVVAAPDIAVVGPLARSAEDLSLALEVTAGSTTPDDAGWRLQLPLPAARTLSGFRVAIKFEDPCCEVDAEYAERLHETARALARAGATVSDTAAPDIDTARAHAVYVLLLRAATSGRQSAAELARWQRIAAETDPGDTSYLALMARGNTLSHREWLALDNERTHLRLRWAEFFRDWDILLCPAAASAAFPHDQAGERHERTIEVNGHPVLTTDQMFWAGFSGVVYLPSTVSPIGLTRSGLPVGVQAIAGHLQDRTAIEFSRLLAPLTGGFVPPPGY
jgi:amidase